MGDLVGIDEMDIHATGHITGCHSVESVGVDEGIALYHLHTVLEGRGAKLLIVIVLWCIHKEIATHDAVHQHGNAAMFTCFAYILSQIVVEG